MLILTHWLAVWPTTRKDIINQDWSSVPFIWPRLFYTYRYNAFGLLRQNRLVLQFARHFSGSDKLYLVIARQIICMLLIYFVWTRRLSGQDKLTEELTGLWSDNNHGASRKYIEIPSYQLTSVSLLISSLRLHLDGFRTMSKQIYLFIYLSIYLSTFLPIYLSIYPSIDLSI